PPGAPRWSCPDPLTLPDPDAIGHLSLHRLTPSGISPQAQEESPLALVARHQAVLGADIAVGGAELAGHAIGGLVDECHLVLCPVVVGGPMS
ncbi:MAG TPA: hypothetical protein VGJ79_04980, partial [Candidatus Dormibacteraeota bacterium]